MRLILLTTTVILSLVTSKAKAVSYYDYPQDVNCGARIIGKNRVNFCEDKDGHAITGEMRIYKDGNLAHVYQFARGVLNGETISYYPDEKIWQKKPYKDGTLDGIKTTYYPDGLIQEEISYVDGKKEGIAKEYNQQGKLRTQYINLENEKNGEERIYDEYENRIYNFENQSNTRIAGRYYYLTPDNELKGYNIPKIIIKAEEEGCLQYHDVLNYNVCAATYNSTLVNCNQTWHNENRDTIQKFMNICNKKNKKDT